MRKQVQRHPFALVLIPLVLGVVTRPAYARIRTPSLSDLVGSADLIVMGKADSVESTPTESLCWALTVALVIGIAAMLALAAWRRESRFCVFAAFAGIVGALLLAVPVGTYRKVALISVQSTISGRLGQQPLLVYYDDGFICDITSFSRGEEYVLFLKRLPTRAIAPYWAI